VHAGSRILLVGSFAGATFISKTAPAKIKMCQLNFRRASKIINPNDFFDMPCKKMLKNNVVAKLLGGCQNWSRRSGPQNLDQIWTKSGPNLDWFLKNGCQNSRQDTLPTYEGINFGFHFV
jgi:hypothetical protein